MKKVKITFLFLMIYIASFAGGIGDLDITINLIPEGTTKKYTVNGNILLDAGDINSESLKQTIEKKIATVEVTMSTKKTELLNRENDYCVIEGGDLTEHYRIRDLKTLGGAKIKTNKLEIYHGNGIGFELYQKNFKIINADVITNDGFNDTYAFSAYPEECMTISGGRDSNLIKSLKYSFEIWIKIENAKVGDIVRTEVTIANNNVSEEAIGAIKDLVREQFKELQK